MGIYDWVEIVFYVTIVGIAAFKTKNFIQRKAKLRKTAELLGLEFSERSPEKELDSELSKLSDPVWRSRVKKLMLLFTPWEMKGTIQGMRVRVLPRNYLPEETQTARHRKVSYLRMEVCFQEKLGLGLQIYSENHSVKKGYDGGDSRAKEIQSGNEELDRKVKIKAVSEERVRKMLSRVDLQQAILNLFQLDAFAVVDDESVRTEERGLNVDPVKYRARLDSLVLVASSIDRAIRFV